MEQPISITMLNDFIFCPVSIYFHVLYDETEKTLYQDTVQINGRKAHETIDRKTYTGTFGTVRSLDVYCSEFDLMGKIDLYDPKECILTERKNLVKQIFDGYVFQLYAQCYAMREMGYEVRQLKIHSIRDNKNYMIPLPENDPAMDHKFRSTIDAVRNFDPDTFQQTNAQKCKNCIYAPACDRGLSDC